MSGVMCDKRLPRKLKCKIYRAAIRTVPLYDAKCWRMREKEDNLLRRRTEMRMLRWMLGVSLKDKIRNDEIRRRCGVYTLKTGVLNNTLRCV